MPRDINAFIPNIAEVPPTFIEEPEPVADEGLKSETAKNSMAFQATIAEEGILGESKPLAELRTMFEARKEELGDTLGYKLVRDQIGALSAMKQKEGVRTLLTNYLQQVDTEEAKKLANDLPVIEASIDQNAVRNDALEQTLLRISQAPNRAERNFIGRQFMFNLIQQIADKEGEWEFISNTMGFFLNDVRIDISRWAKSGFWDADKIGANIIRNFKMMPIEDQVRAFPVWAEEILKAADDNERKTVGRLLQFLAPDGDRQLINEANWDLAFWGIDIATLALGPIIRSVAKGTRTVEQASKLSKRMGDMERAGETTAASLADESGKLSRGFNTPNDVNAQNAMPITGAEIDSTTFTANISGKTMEKLRGLEQEVAKKISGEDLLKGELLTPAEKQKLGDKFLGRWRTAAEAEGARFQSLKLTPRGETGFDIVADYGSKKNGEVYLSKSGAQKRLKELKDEGFIKPEQTASVVAKDGGFTIRAKQSVDFLINDTGDFAGKELAGPLSSLLSSPSFHLAPFFGREAKILEGALRAELGSAKIVSEFNEAIRAVINPLGAVGIPFTRGRNSLNKVDQILLQGDAAQVQHGMETTRGIIYTPDQLRQGIVIPTRKGNTVVQLTRPEEVEAYYGLRRIFDLLYSIKNEGERRKLALRGMKSIDFNGQKAVGRPFDEFRGASTSLQNQKPNRIWDQRANDNLGGIVETDIDAIKLGYEEGLRLVRFEEPRVMNGVGVRNALVHHEDISDLPFQVLHYKDGYVPKIAKGAYYFVKEAIRGNIEGRANQVLRRHTLRIFDSKRAAEAWAARERNIRGLLEEAVNVNNPQSYQKAFFGMRELGLADEEITTLLEKGTAGEVNFIKAADDIRVFTDREVGIAKIDEEALGNSGGLFTSPRAKHDILFGSHGEVPKRFSAFESLQRNIQHVANFHPRAEWLMGMQQRWLNTAHSMGAVDPRINNYRKATKSILAPVGSPERATLSSAARWIDDQARIPTASEQWFSNVSRKLGEWAEGVPGLGQTPLSRWALRFSTKDPFALGRAAAFHTLLGWFNPAQLFVQAQGFSIAASLHPQHFMKGMRGSFGLTTVAYADATTKVGKTYVRNVGKALGYDPEEFLLLKNLLDESGLVQSIKQTADHAASIQGHGTTFDAIRRVSDRGLMFYRRGELFTRTYGLTTAIELWKTRSGKALKAMTRDEFKDVLAEAVGLNLNMFRSNRAAWQKGVFSIPTQFLQIQAKWIESLWPTMMGGKGGALGPLSTQQKMKFAMMQAALYGAAGIPLGNWMVNQGLAYYGLEPQDIEESTKVAINGGAWNLFFNQVIGAENEFAARGAIANDIFKNMNDMIFKEAPATAMLGAFGEIPNRFGQAMSKFRPLVANAQKINWTSRELAFVASELAKVTATWRNATKAHYMFKTNTIRDRKGNILIDKTLDPEGKFNLQTIIGQALGFSPSEQRAVAQLRRINQHNDEIVQDITETLINHFYDYLGGVVGAIPNPKVSENFSIMMDYYMNMLDPEMQQRVRNSLLRKIEQQEDVRTQQIRKWFRNMSEEMADALVIEGGVQTNILLNAPDELGPE